MKTKDGKQRTSEGQGYERGQPESQPRSLGTFPSTSAEYGYYEVGTGRKDCNEPDIVVTGQQSISEFSGKFISQLIDETEKQLAYYEQQAEVLRDRLKELKQIPESLTDVNHTE